MANEIEEEVMSTFRLGINKLERNLGIEPDFHQSLLNADDWTFILKTSALLEATTSHALVVMLGYDNLSKFITKMPQSNRLEMLKAIGGITSSQTKPYKKISGLRNVIVHNIKNHAITLEEYFSAMEKQTLNEWVDAFSDMMSSLVEKHEQKEELFKIAPKSIIWNQTLLMLWHLHTETEVARLTKERNENILNAIERGEPVPKLKRRLKT